MFLLKKIKKATDLLLWIYTVFLEKKKKIFEIVMEYLKLMSGYGKSFADSSKKLMSETDKTF